MLTKHQPLLFTLQTLIESLFTLCWRSWMEKIKRQVQATYQDSEDLRSSHKVELGIGWPYISICPRSLGCVWCSDGIINSTSFTLRSVLVWIRDHLVSVVRKGSQCEVPLGNGGTIGCHSWAESWAFGSTGSTEGEKSCASIDIHMLWQPTCCPIYPSPQHSREVLLSKLQDGDRSPRKGAMNLARFRGLLAQSAPTSAAPTAWVAVLVSCF